MNAVYIITNVANLAACEYASRDAAAQALCAAMGWPGIWWAERFADTDPATGTECRVWWAYASELAAKVDPSGLCAPRVLQLPSP